MKKLNLSACIFILISLLYGCKKNTIDVAIENEPKVNPSIQVFKSWLVQNGSRFATGEIKTGHSKPNSKDIVLQNTGSLDWEHPTSYMSKGLIYTQIPFKFSDTVVTGSKKSEFSMVFRTLNNKIEAKLKIASKGKTIDSSKSYYQESFYTLDGLLSEVWMYTNNKAYKVDPKVLTKKSTINPAQNYRTCFNFSYSGYTLECYGDGNYGVSCYYASYIYPVSLCFDDQNVLSHEQESDFGGGGGGFETPPPPDQCDANAVYPEVQQFNDYITSTEANSDEYTGAPTGGGAGDPIVGSKPVNVVVASISAWKIMADMSWKYYRSPQYFNGTNYFYEYDLFEYSTSNGYYVGNNTFITTKYTTTTPTINQVVDNNTSNTHGMSIIMGTIESTLNVAIRFPFCQPLTLKDTKNINVTKYLYPQ